MWPIHLDDLIKQEDEGHEKPEAGRISLVRARKLYQVLVVKHDRTPGKGCKQPVQGVEALEEPLLTALCILLFIFIGSHQQAQMDAVRVS